MKLETAGVDWWCVDCEFIRLEGDRPTPVCAVAIEAVSGREIRLWADELNQLAGPSFPIDKTSVVVAYMATAEMSCFRALGWPMPTYLLDLYAEFVRITNNQRPPDGVSLLGALAYFGLPSITSSEKDHWRKRIMAGPPYSDADRAGILDYCATDVVALRQLLPLLLPRILS